MTYDAVFYSRMLTSVTLGFHIIFATIGVGLPFFIAIAEWLGIKRNDPDFTMMARRWSRAFTITVAVGVVTGTSIGMQLNLLWPTFMKVAGQIIALPLFMETFAFFVEAIFLGIYLYTWNRFKNPYIHVLLLVPVVLGSTLSAFFITTVNAFMNAPQGFALENGVLTNLDPLAAMFNPATPTKGAHVINTAFLTSAFIIACGVAWGMLKGRVTPYAKKALKLTLSAALVFSISTIIIGDLSGKYLAAYQPVKLAAAEWHFNTEEHASLYVGGVLDAQKQEIKYALELPWMLSILVGHVPSTIVQGLNDFPKDLHPPLFIHYLFDSMVSLGMYLFSVSLLYVIALWRKWSWVLDRKWFYVLVVFGGPFAMLAIEFGWVFAEIGRQPWILVGYLKTNHAATTSPHVDKMLILFIALYTVLGTTAVIVLRKLFKRLNATPDATIEVHK